MRIKDIRLSWLEEQRIRCASSLIDERGFASSILAVNDYRLPIYGHGRSVQVSPSIHGFGARPGSA